MLRFDTRCIRDARCINPNQKLSVLIVQIYGNPFSHAQNCKLTSILCRLCHVCCLLVLTNSIVALLRERENYCTAGRWAPCHWPEIFSLPFIWSGMCLTWMPQGRFPWPWYLEYDWINIHYWEYLNQELWNENTFIFIIAIWMYVKDSDRTDITRKTGLGGSRQPTINSSGSCTS